jgi:hypothetical protein
LHFRLCRLRENLHCAPHTAKVTSPPQVGFSQGKETSMVVRSFLTRKGTCQPRPYDATPLRLLPATFIGPWLKALSHHNSQLWVVWRSILSTSVVSPSSYKRTTAAGEQREFSDSDLIPKKDNSLLLA